MKLKSFYFTSLFLISIISSNYAFQGMQQHGGGHQFPEKITVEKDFTVAKIGKEEIKMSEIAFYANQLNKFLKDNFVNSPEWRSNFVRDFVALKAIEKFAISQGIDKREDVQRKLKETHAQILANFIVNNELSLKFKVTEEDKKKFYEDNKNRFVESARVKLRHIEISQDTNGEAILERLKKGEDFGSLVKEFSEDVNTKENGGLLPEYIALDMPPMELPGLTQEIAEELLKLKKDELSHLIKIGNKYHIFKADEVIEARQKTYEQARQEEVFDSEVEKAVKDKIIFDLIKQIFQTESVTIFEEDVKKAIFNTK